MADVGILSVGRYLFEPYVVCTCQSSLVSAVSCFGHFAKEYSPSFVLLSNLPARPGSFLHFLCTWNGEINELAGIGTVQLNTSFRKEVRMEDRTVLPCHKFACSTSTLSAPQKVGLAAMMKLGVLSSKVVPEKRKKKRSKP